MKNITVIGVGVLGSQITFQTAVHGFKVTACDLSDDILDASKKAIESIATMYQVEIPGTTVGQITQGLANISYTTDPIAAVSDADMVIEAITEDLEQKRTLYRSIAGVLPARTIVCTNSSTLLPSDMMDATGCPERFLGLHYANHIWTMNCAEVMATSKTDPAVYEQVVQFATDTGMVAVPLKKEKAGWLLNSLSVPFLDAASKLYGGGYANPKDIDSIWRIGTGSPKGPFQYLDIIGLKTAYHIMSMSRDPDVQNFSKIVKEKYLDEGKLGIATGEGFYSYK
jgi:3-hydroxyacyl-CoA dehydrogenase